MKNHFQQPHGKASFATNLLEVSAQSTFPNSRFSVKCSFKKQPHKPHPLAYVPDLDQGSLVLLLRESVCTHVGMMTEVSEQAETLTCVSDLWAMPEDVIARQLPVSAPSGLRTFRPRSYNFLAKTTDCEFYGSLFRLRAENAEHMRAQLGPFVPDAIRQIFWSEGEISQLEANAIAQERYVQLAQELIDCQGA